MWLRTFNVTFEKFGSSIQNFFFLHAIKSILNGNKNGNKIKIQINKMQIISNVTYY